MTNPDYTAQHRMVALQCATQLSRLTLFTNVKKVLDLSETLLAYLNDGTLPE